jgi:amino acid adenylation domain-containing protein
MILSKLEPNLDEVFVFPASFAQQRLWLIEQLVPESSLYLTPLVFRMSGRLDHAALAQSWQAMVDRHEILRTCFEVVEGQLVQVILPKLEVSLPRVDLQTLPAVDREAIALAQMRHESEQPFNLKSSPLFRVRLWQVKATDHLLLILLHHIIFDEWSSGVLIRELGAYYQSFVQRTPVASETLPIQYADFAHWQRQWLQGDVLNAQLGYWRQQLKDIQTLDLPTVAPRTATPTHRGASQLIELPQRLLDALEALSQEAGATLFMTLLAGFQTLLHRYSGQTDIAVGSPIANRHRSELEGLIGFLVNSLVLRTDLSGDPTFRELLNRVRDVTLAAYAHQDVPFEKLVEELQPARNLGQNPLFQVVFALQNAPMEQLELPELSLSSLEFETQTTRFDLEVYVWQSAGNFRSLWGKGWQQADGLRGVVVYNTDLFDAETIAALRCHFQTLLEGIVANPDTPLSMLPLLTVGQQQRIIATWNATQTDYPDCCIHELFEERARQYPYNIAVQFEDQRFTYQELNQGSNQLAHYLKRLGVKTGMLVGICLERSPEAVAAMLAVLKVGGAYLPLDPSYPVERLNFLLEDAQVSLVVTEQAWADLFAESECQNLLQIICLEQVWNAINCEPETNLPTLSESDQLAYVMYTSGSTGTPKGVMVAHRAVMRLVCNTNYVQIQPEDRIAQVANLAFDAATFEVWGALLNGARLVGIDRETTLIPAQFAAALQEQQMSILFLTTALLNQTVAQVPDAFRSLKYLLFGGEMANPDRVRDVLNHGKPQHLLHVYGPTENTTFSTWYEVENITENAVTIPIGQAISNTQVYLLDVNLKPVPTGMSGEIYLAGDGLAKGYLNRPELTEEKFIHNPFTAKDRPVRLYKTGDLARCCTDGHLEFLGRVDHQIKIRGFRVELGEIEAILMQHSSVQAAVVTVREVDADRQLIAYVVHQFPKLEASKKQRDCELRAFLKAKLPAYMVPVAFVGLDALPLTSNGKVDQRALLSLPISDSEIPTIAPTTSLEKALVDLWQQLLGREVGIHDNFFELGGHSLLATQLVSRIRDRLQIEIPLRSVFETPTIAELARQMEGQPQPPQPSDAAIQLTPLTTVPLSFAQQRLWFLDQLAPNNPFYNMPAAIRLQGKLEHRVLERSFNEIVRRHAALRTTFRSLDGKAVQVIAPEVKITLPVIDLRSVSSTERETLMQQFATAEAQRPFNLSTESLLRVTLLQFDATEAVLLLTLHHIVADGWSLGVLVRELGCCYTAFLQGHSPALPALPIQYADFSEWQRQWLQGDVLATHLTYWRKQLQNLPTLDLPTDHRRPAVQTYRGATYPLHCSPVLTQQLLALSQQAGVSLFMVLLAAFQALLHRYTGQTDIPVGSPIANRHRSELEGLIGFFVNSLVLRTDLTGNPTFRELIERVRDVALAAYMHQDLPFEKLVEDLEPERDLSRNPLFQVAFALQNAPMQPLELPEIRLEPVPLEAGTTRFDLEVHLWEPAHGLRSLWQSQEGLSGFIAYSTDLFERDTISRLVGHFQTLLGGAVAHPDVHLTDLPLLTSTEQQQIFDWNQTDSELLEAGRCFHQIFEAQAQQFPDAVAVVTELESLTYQELNHRADHLAHFLRQMGIQADRLVGLCVDRSIEMVVGILAILKAGGAYVPFDPSYPKDRIQFMLMDTQVQILLTQSWLAKTLPPSKLR